jgi:hypothetical protein
MTKNTLTLKTVPITLEKSINKSDLATRIHKNRMVTVLMTMNTLLMAKEIRRMSKHSRLAVIVKMTKLGRILRPNSLRQAV